MPEPRFHENWFAWHSQEALRQLVGRVGHLEGDVVEVGSWEGRSTVILARAVHPATVHAVDTWAGAESEPDQQSAAAERDVHAQFLANMAAFTDGNVEAHREPWETYFARVDRPIRFLHIDGAHDYDSVADNIRAALPKLVPGAVLCGDDHLHPPVTRAVADTVGAVETHATLWAWTAPARINTEVTGG